MICSQHGWQWPGWRDWRANDQTSDRCSTSDASLYQRKLVQWLTAQSPCYKLLYTLMFLPYTSRRIRRNGVLNEQLHATERVHVGHTAAVAVGVDCRLILIISQKYRERPRVILYTLWNGPIDEMEIAFFIVTDTTLVTLFICCVKWYSDVYTP